MENKRVSEKLRDGDYKTTLPFKAKKLDSAVNAAYRADFARLEDQFKVDALVELNLLKLDAEGNEVYKHPKADLLWSKAWDRGHSSGLSEVWFDLEDLSELLSEVK
jgi:hypothetical protein